MSDSIRSLRKPIRGSETLASKANIIQFQPRVDSDDPQDPEPAPDASCSRRPRMYRIQDYRANIIAAAKNQRHYRSIAAQYGINSLEVWKIVTGALPKKQLSKEAA